MKSTITLLFTLITITSNLCAQVPENFICDKPVPLEKRCNYILNPEFSSHGTTDAFNLFEVDKWAASHGTPDININYTSPPSGTNYATMSVGYDPDASKSLDEGIVTRITQLEAKKKYVFSFFRAFGTTTINSLPLATDIVLKVVLLHCKDIPFSDGSSDSYVVPDYQRFSHQVIYCEPLPDPDNFPWKQVIFNFVTEEDFDAVMIFAERQNSGNAEYSEIYLAYPELLAAPEVKEPEHGRNNGCMETVSEIGLPDCLFRGGTPPVIGYTVSTQPNIIYPVTSWPFVMSFRAHGWGTYRFFAQQTDFLSGNTCSENVLGVEVASFIASPDDCDCVAQTCFDCSNELVNGCNLVSNPQMDALIPGISLNIESSNWPGATYFMGNVRDWEGIIWTADLFGSWGNPWSFTPPFTGVNFAGMLPDVNETIVVKTAPIKQGKTYMLSFFAKLPPPFNDDDDEPVSLKAILTKCQNFLPAAPPPLNLVDKQEIFCGSLATPSNADWKQFVVSFTADDDYEMMVIAPDKFSWGGYLLFAYPELIDITASYGRLWTYESSRWCTYILGPSQVCSVKNAQFIWTGPSGNILYTGSAYQPLVISNQPSGNYTLSMSVPGAATSNNTCSNNNPVIQAVVRVRARDCGPILQPWPGGEIVTEFADKNSSAIVAQEKQNELTIIPTLVSSRFKVFTTSAIKQVMLYSADGKMVKQLNKVPAEGIDIANLLPGVYYVVVYTADGARKTKPIFKE